jgi:hypothetical protein
MAFVPVWNVWMISAVVILAAWEMVWKSIALWKAARNDQLGWYIPLIIFNTAGILPIIYIAFFSKPKKAARRR